MLAALAARPSLLQPLALAPGAVDAFRALLSALPARHRSHLAAGKGWQGACARAAQDACAVLPRQLPRGGGRFNPVAGGSSGAVGAALPLLGCTLGLAGLTVAIGLHRREVAGVVQAYAGRPAAERLDEMLLTPLEAALAPALPALDALMTAAAPAVTATWEAAAPVLEAAHTAALPALEAVRRAAAPALERAAACAGPALEAVRHAAAPVLERAAATAGPALEAVHHAAAPVLEAAHAAVLPALEAVRARLLALLA